MRKTVIKSMLIITALLLLIVLVFALFNNRETHENEHSPSPVEIMYDLKYLGEDGCDLTDYFTSLLSDPDYFDFGIKDDYAMFFQVRDQQQKIALEQKLCLEKTLPEIDFSSNYLIVSVGKKFEIQGISIPYDETGDAYPNIGFEENGYDAAKAYIYSMKKINFVSGEVYEKYLFDHEMPLSNMIFTDLTKGKTPLEEGRHYKLYDLGEKKYFAVFFNNSGETVKRPLFKEYRPLITEYSENMIRVEKQDTTYYFDVARELQSEDYDFPTEYFINDIISYMRDHNGELQLILRDAYDQYKYAKIVHLDFSYEVEDISTLVKSIEYLDDYHIRVTYITTGNVEKTEAVEVYDLRNN